MKTKNKMNNPYAYFKNTTSGITLIALIITIIVLLILAGISIVSITGENGLLSRAADAKEKKIISEDKERIDLTLSEYKLLKYKPNSPTIEELFESKEWCKNATLDGNILKVEMTNGNKYDVEVNIEEDLTPVIKFYQPYQATVNGTTIEYIFHEDGSIDMYAIDLKEAMSLPAGTATYEEGILTLNGEQSIINESGKSITVKNGSENITLNLIPKKIHYIYYGSKYVFTNEENNSALSIIFYEDGSMEMTENGETEHFDKGTAIFYDKTYEFDGEKQAVYPDGTKIIFFGMIMEVDCLHTNTEIKNKTDNYSGDTYCKDCGILIEYGMYLTGEPYALYFDSNKTLVFARSESTLNVGDTYRGNEISAVYTGFEVDRYTLGGGKTRAAIAKEATTPWFEHAYDIVKVKFDCIIKPVSTAVWFYSFENCSSIDLTNLDMSKVDDASNMFKDCYSLTNLNGFNLKNKVVIIDSIFENCSLLSDFSKITIPSTVEYMNNAFYNCTSMTIAPNLNKATNVITMSYAFCNCENLTVAPNIPSAQDMGGIFANCYKLTTAPVLPDNLLYGNNMFDNCETLVTYHGSTEDNGHFKNYSIPSSVQYLDSAFYYCKLLISVPDLDHCTKLKSIDTTFRDCKSLIQAPKLPASIEDMSMAFAYDENLETAPALDHCTKLTDMGYAFLSCRKITVAPIIPNTVTNIKETFANTNINTYHNSTDPIGDFSNYIIPDGITSINGTFKCCLGIGKAPIIPENIKDMSVAFDECRNLTSITINANPTSYGSCFRVMTNDVTSPTKNLVLSGSSTMLQELANTSSKRIVYDANGNILKQ